MSDVTEPPAEEDPPEPVDTKTPEPDPSDPNVVAAQLREQLTASETRYQQQLAAARQAQERERQTNERLTAVTSDKTMLEFSTISNALDAATARGEQLQSEYAKAMESADYATAGKLQMEMGRIASRIETLEAGKNQFEQSRNDKLRQPTPAEPAAPAADPIEADLATRDPQSAAWIRQHTDASGKPRFYTDPQFQARVIGAHNLALGNGMAVNSPEYFEFVERTSGVAAQNNNAPATPPAQPRQVPSAVPPRSSGNPGAPRAQSGHIPAEAVRWAKQIGVDPKEYWDECNRMEAAGEFKQGGNPWKRRA